MGAQVSNVVSLSDRPPINEPNQETIEALERLLQMAKDGAIVGIMWAGLRTDARPDCGWTTAPDGLSYASGIVGLTYKYGQGLWEE